MKIIHLENDVSDDLRSVGPAVGSKLSEKEQLDNKTTASQI